MAFFRAKAGQKAGFRVFTLKDELQDHGLFNLCIIVSYFEAACYTNRGKVSF